MQIIELDLQDETVVRCPFCGRVLCDKDGLYQCPHLLFHASDCGPEFVREDFPYKFDMEPDIEGQGETPSFWEHIETIEIPYTFCFALVVNAPPGMCGSGFVGYVGLSQYP